jgi:hypothetical protein
MKNIQELPLMSCEFIITKSHCEACFFLCGVGWGREKERRETDKGSGLTLHFIPWFKIHPSCLLGQSDSMAPQMGTQQSPQMRLSLKLPLLELHSVKSELKPGAWFSWTYWWCYHQQKERNTHESEWTALIQGIIAPLLNYLTATMTKLLTEDVNKHAQI